MAIIYGSDGHIHYQRDGKEHDSFIEMRNVARKCSQKTEDETRYERSGGTTQNHPVLCSKWRNKGPGGLRPNSYHWYCLVKRFEVRVKHGKHLHRAGGRVDTCVISVFSVQDGLGNADEQVRYVFGGCHHGRDKRRRDSFAERIRMQKTKQF